VELVEGHDICSVKTANDFDRAKQVKTQTVRLIDIFFLGPLMMYSASFPGPPLWVRYVIAVGGLATIFYNLNNYIIIKNNPQLETF
jgi:hypothetical protein